MLFLCSRATVWQTKNARFVSNIIFDSAEFLFLPHPNLFLSLLDTEKDFFVV